MKQELISTVLTIFLQNIEKLEFVDNEGEITCSLTIYHPLGDYKNSNDLQYLKLTGFKLFLEYNGKDRLEAKVFEIEFLSQRGQFPKWMPTTGIPYEQLIIRDIDEDSKLYFSQFDEFLKAFEKWDEENREKRCNEIVVELVDYKTKLTFEDPFQTWYAKTVEQEQNKKKDEEISSYQGESPEIMDFERKDENTEAAD